MILTRAPEIKRIVVEIDKTLHRQLKRTAATTGLTMKQIIRSAIFNELEYMAKQVQITGENLDEMFIPIWEKKKIKRRIKKVSSSQS